MSKLLPERLALAPKGRLGYVVTFLLTQRLFCANLGRVLNVLMPI